MAATPTQRSKVESTLSTPCFASLKTLLGPVITERLSAPDHECYLVRLLKQGNERILARWEQPCSLFLKAVRSAIDAVEKFKTERTGVARKCPPAEFDAFLGDSFAEIAVVAALSQKGVSDFMPLVPRQEKKGKKRKAPDYSCVLNGGELGSAFPVSNESAYLELKNLRAPITIVLNHTKRGQVVYNPFLGSGTTLIAAELTERVCYGIELDPKYVDVIVTRWQNFTGAHATLGAGGQTFEQVKDARLGVAA
jgi:hypothetical protein